MAELPSIVRVKRKRDADPTPDLYLEERQQRIWQFRLQHSLPNEKDASSLPSHTQQTSANDAVDGTNEAQDVSLDMRHFRLHIDKAHSQAVQNQLAELGTASRKRKKHGEDDAYIPTFVEVRAKKHKNNQGEGTAVTTVSTSTEEDKPSTALKRPGAGAKERQWRSDTWKKSTAPAAKPPPAPDRLADVLHTFALEEAAREEAGEKARVTPPRKPVQRYRDRHPEHFTGGQRAAPQNHNADVDADVGMGMGMDMDIDADASDDDDNDDDYVFDTYVRTREPVVPFAADAAHLASKQVGYIVITEEDRPIWETYFEDDGSDKEFDTDDEDENAEGYYGADYPEDEVASDDEYDRGAYGYRHGASDDEQWQSDEDAWSGEEDLQQNPWRKYPWIKNSRDALAASDDGKDEDEKE